MIEKIIIFYSVKYLKLIYYQAFLPTIKAVAKPTRVVPPITAAAVGWPNNKAILAVMKARAVTITPKICPLLFSLA